MSFKNLGSICGFSNSGDTLGTVQEIWVHQEFLRCDAAKFSCDLSMHRVEFCRIRVFTVIKNDEKLS